MAKGDLGFLEYSEFEMKSEKPKLIIPGEKPRRSRSSSPPEYESSGDIESVLGEVFDDPFFGKSTRSKGKPKVAIKLSTSEASKPRESAIQSPEFTDIFGKPIMFEAAQKSSGKRSGRGKASDSLVITLEMQSLIRNLIVPTLFAVLAYIPAHKDQKFSERVQLSLRVFVYAFALLIFSRFMEFIFKSIENLSGISDLSFTLLGIAMLVICVMYFSIIKVFTKQL